jgi:hypothetical protein
MTSGILDQIKHIRKGYYSELTLDDLNKFIDQLTNNKPQRDLVVYLGDFGSRYATAIVKNDEVELEKLRIESLILLIQRYNDISKLTGCEYDIIYMLSSIFSLRLTFDSDVVWEIYTNYNHENEYDDSYECQELRWSKGYWTLEKYCSDGYYENKKLEEISIDKEFLFELILSK